MIITQTKHELACHHHGDYVPQVALTTVFLCLLQILFLSVTTPCARWAGKRHEAEQSVSTNMASVTSLPPPNILCERSFCPEKMSYSKRTFSRTFVLLDRRIQAVPSKPYWERLANGGQVKEIVLDSLHSLAGSNLNR